MALALQFSTEQLQFCLHACYQYVCLLRCDASVWFQRVTSVRLYSALYISPVHFCTLCTFT